MKLAFALVGLGLLAAPAAFAQPGPAEGEALFTARCAMCHGTGMGGAPLTEKLKADTAESILEKITTGSMAPMAAGISDAEKRDIAMWLSGKELPAAAPAAADSAAPPPAPAADTATPAPTAPTSDPAAPTAPAPQQ